MQPSKPCLRHPRDVDACDAQQNPRAVPDGRESHMSKREHNAGGSGPNKKRRYVSGPQAARHDLQPGHRGVLLSCDVHVERDAIREAFRLFEQLLDEAEESAKPAAAAATPKKSVTAADALEAELAELQKERGGSSGDGGKKDGKAPPPRLSVSQTGCNGNVFIRVAESAPIDPVTLVDRAMARAKLGGAGSRAPHIIRMVPIQRTVSARSAEDLGNGITPLVESTLSASFGGTYAVLWRRRCNNDIDKMGCINAVAAALNKHAPKATVDLNHAECGLVTEVIKTTCCLAVLPRWKEFKGYNFRAVSGIEPPPSDGVKPAAAAKDE